MLRRKQIASYIDANFGKSPLDGGMYYDATDRIKLENYRRFLQIICGGNHMDAESVLYGVEPRSWKKFDSVEPMGRVLSPLW